MGTVHFIRHGDTEASGDGVFSGDLDISARRERRDVQAKALAHVRLAPLSIAAVYASPKLRVRMTAEPTCRALGLEARFEEGLREIGYGAWEGRHEKEIRATDADVVYAAWVADPASMLAPRRREPASPRSPPARCPSWSAS